MLNFAEWEFEAEAKPRVEALGPWHDRLFDAPHGGEPPWQRRRRVVHDLVDVRSGFDHGWTNQPIEQVSGDDRAPVDALERSGLGLVEELAAIVESLPTTSVG